MSHILDKDFDTGSIIAWLPRPKPMLLDSMAMLTQDDVVAFIEQQQLQLAIDSLDYTREH